MPKDEDFVFFGMVFLSFFLLKWRLSIQHIGFFLLKFFVIFIAIQKKICYFFFCDVLYRQPPFEQKKLENNIQKKRKSLSLTGLRHVSLLTLPNKKLYIRHETSILPKDEHMFWRVKCLNFLLVKGLVLKKRLQLLEKKRGDLNV